jgi:hypothetical protein
MPANIQFGKNIMQVLGMMVIQKATPAGIQILPVDMPAAIQGIMPAAMAIISANVLKPMRIF